MKLKLAWIGKTKEAAIASLTAEYLKRLGRYVSTEGIELKSETALREFAAKQRATLVLLDVRGKQMSSEELAAFFRDHQQRGTQTLLFAIGPAGGFTDAARRAAAVQLSLGKMTLPHELARVVVAEQLYRAFTVLAGHPYHRGH
ncbi:MAG TPA: 23S rRNA (pseudouridine(1915)-N(3))-methyltransferase RlmH [Terriglobales bacterium]|nr:23S rRNA (pseudouridine(1915)-N(3))-methyltransferase RlmH [Terriglobales bacterium]